MREAKTQKYQYAARGNITSRESCWFVRLLSYSVKLRFQHAYKLPG